MFVSPIFPSWLLTFSAVLMCCLFSHSLAGRMSISISPDICAGDVLLYDKIQHRSQHAHTHKSPGDKQEQTMFQCHTKHYDWNV
jgi:hypothetical protein